MHVYSLAGNTLHEKTALEHNGAVTSLKYSPDGSMLAAADTYRKVLLYQLPEYTVCCVIRTFTACNVKCYMSPCVIFFVCIYGEYILMWYSTFCS